MFWETSSFRKTVPTTHRFASRRDGRSKFLDRDEWNSWFTLSHSFGLVTLNKTTPPPQPGLLMRFKLSRRNPYIGEGHLNRDPWRVSTPCDSGTNQKEYTTVKT